MGYAIGNIIILVVLLDFYLSIKLSLFSACTIGDGLVK